MSNCLLGEDCGNLARIEALEGALRNCIAELESMAHSEFDGVWSDEDFDELTGRFQAILSNKGDSDAE